MRSSFGGWPIIEMLTVLTSAHRRSTAVIIIDDALGREVRAEEAEDGVVVEIQA